MSINRIFLLPIIFFTLFQINPSRAYDSKAQANGAIMVITACTWYQMGQINRSQIMDFAKKTYRSKYGDPSKVNCSGAITIAEKIDRKKVRMFKLDFQN